MKLFKKLFQKISGAFKSLAPEKPQVDLSVIPVTFKPDVRPSLRSTLWLRVITKARLRITRVSKLEKRMIRRNVFQGHWSPANLRRNAA